MNGYEPRRPHLVALGLLSLWIVILALPMLGGQWLASPYGDQYAAGYAFRSWGAEQWRALGHVPLWNPTLFGGLPFVAAGHGDIFYPTSFLRLVLPVATVVNLGFALHYILAGLFTYAFLRLLRVSWTASVVGALAYQLSGLIASYAQPGHDGKLFASTALPLAFIALILALRDKRWMGYPLLGVSVALTILGHFQLAYYSSVAMGIFALYLAFGQRETERLGPIVARLAGASGAVLVGFGLTAIQTLPFFAYIPFSPRAEAYQTFGGATAYASATSYAIPWNHVPEFLLATFVGSRETYWGGNPAKLHSEYLGLPVIALAILGAADRGRRRLIWLLGGIGLLFLLVSLGGSTPFYRLWWTVMPLMQKVRAAGMAFYIPSFVVATLAAFGVQRIERREGAKHLPAWLVAAGIIGLLAAAGLIASMAQSLATAVPPSPFRDPVAAARAGRSAITFGALGSALALGLVGALVLAWYKDRLKAGPFALLLVLLVGADLWRNATGFWTYTRAHKELFGLDPITAHLRHQSLPYRVLELGVESPALGVYPGDGVTLMAFDIPQLLGHHGNELHRFDELMGGRNQWRNLSPQILDLFAVQYIISAARPEVQELPGYHVVMDSVPTSSGATGRLFERTEGAPYARVVPGGVKLPDSLIVPTLVDPRLPGHDRVVFFSPDTPVNPDSLIAWPEPSPSRATVTEWKPGSMAITLDPAPARLSYVLVAENWYPDWEAAVDEAPGQVLRGNHTMITVPVPAGARTVRLEFRSAEYRRGKLISLLSLGLVLLGFAAPWASRWRRRA